LAVYKSFGIAPTTYTSTTSVSTVSIPVEDHSDSFCTEIWGYFKPVTDAVSPKLSMMDSSNNPIRSFFRTSSAATTSTLATSPTNPVTESFMTRYTAGNDVGEFVSFQLKYFGHQSTQSVYASPWLVCDTLYEINTNTIQGSRLVLYTSWDATVGYIRFKFAGSDIKEYYIHKAPLLGY
jgi:hypothetical protein